MYINSLEQQVMHAEREACASAKLSTTSTGWLRVASYVAVRCSSPHRLRKYRSKLAGKVCAVWSDKAPSAHIDRSGCARTTPPRIYISDRARSPHNARGRARSPVTPLARGAALSLFSLFLCSSVSRWCGRAEADAGAAMPRCLMAKKWKAAPANELAYESEEEIDVVGEGRGRSPAPAATAPGPSPRDPEPTLLYNGEHLLLVTDLSCL